MLPVLFSGEKKWQLHSDVSIHWPKLFVLFSEFPLRLCGSLLTELWLTKSREVLWFLPREHDLHSIQSVFV